MNAALQLSRLLEGYATVPPGQDVAVSAVASDSRAVRAGALFLACAGTGRHGLSWVDEAIARGSVAVAWEPVAGVDVPAIRAGVPTIAVPALRTVAGHIAARFHGHPSLQLDVIGITGTNGKTSVTHLVAQALDMGDTPCGVIGTLGYGRLGALEKPSHTTPDATVVQALLASLQAAGSTAVAMEVSSHALDQDRVGGVRFRVAVFTNLSRDHLDYHADMDAYGAAKRRLFESDGLTAAVVNIDDAFGRALLDGLPDAVHDTAVGLPGAAGFAARYVELSMVETDASGMRLQLTTHAGDVRIRSVLMGAFNATNLALAAGVLLELGLGVAEVGRRLSRVRTVPGRMEAFRGGDGQPLVIVDYAHTPDALEKVLQAARAHTTGALTCVFGCGGDRDRGKRPMMAAVAAAWADHCIVTDDNPRGEAPATIVADIIEGFPAAADWKVEHDRAAAIAMAVESAGAGDTVVVAGKGHEDYQLVGSRILPFSDRQSVLGLLTGGAT